MGYISSQVQDIVTRLKQAGLKRSQFTARAERNYIPNSVKNYGKAMYEYGDVSIIINTLSKSDYFTILPTLVENDFHITLYKFSDGRVGYPHVYDSNKWADKPAGIFLWDEHNKDEIGLYNVIEVSKTLLAELTEIVNTVEGHSNDH